MAGNPFMNRVVLDTSVIVKWFSASNFFLPQFIQRFLPERKSLSAFPDTRSFSPKRRLNVKANPEANYKPLTLRIVDVTLPGSKTATVFITTLLERSQYPPRALRNLYHYPWQEEEFFETIKEHLRAEDFRGRSVRFIDQKLLSTYRYYILTRIMMLAAAQQHAQPLENVETKAALLGVARYLDRLLLAANLEQCQDLCRRGLAEISWRTYRPRPGRKLPRRSKSRHGNWADKWG
jgi:hypothetical protein